MKTVGNESWPVLLMRWARMGVKTEAHIQSFRSWESRSHCIVQDELTNLLAVSPPEGPEGTPFTKAGGDTFMGEPQCSLCRLLSVARSDGMGSCHSTGLLDF